MKSLSLPPAVQRWWPLVTAGTLAVAATVVLRRMDPFAPGSGLPPCPVHALTGLYCPGCGSTRCLYSLAHLDLATALAMNPVLVLCLPLLLLMLLSNAGLRVPGSRRLLQWLANPRLWLVLLGSYSVLRNLPWPPFSWLAPGAL